MGKEFEYDIEAQKAIKNLEYYRQIFLSTQMPNTQTLWRMQLLYRLAVAINDISDVKFEWNAKNVD